MKPQQNFKAISLCLLTFIFCWLRDFIYRTGKDCEKGRLRIQGPVLFISIPSDWWIGCVTTDLDKLNSIACYLECILHKVLRQYPVGVKRWRNLYLSYVRRRNQQWFGDANYFCRCRIRRLLRRLYRLVLLDTATGFSLHAKCLHSLPETAVNSLSHILLRVIRCHRFICINIIPLRISRWLLRTFDLLMIRNCGCTGGLGDGSGWKDSSLCWWKMRGTWWLDWRVATGVFSRNPHHRHHWSSVKIVCFRLYLKQFILSRVVRYKSTIMGVVGIV